MAIIIQNLANIVNILDTSKAAGEQVIQTIPKTSIAVGQANAPYDIVNFINGEGFTTYKLQLNGLIEYQDIAGVATLWAGTLDAFLNKINSEYFVAGAVPNPLPVTIASLPLPTGAATETTLQAVEAAISALKDGEFRVLSDPNDNNRLVGLTADMTNPAVPVYVYRYLDNNAAYAGDVNDLEAGNIASSNALSLYRKPQYYIQTGGTNITATPQVFGNFTLGYNNGIVGGAIFDDASAVAAMGQFANLAALIVALNSVQGIFEFYEFTAAEIARTGTNESVIGVRSGTHLVNEQWGNILGLSIDGAGFSGALYRLPDDTTTLDMILDRLVTSAIHQAAASGYLSAMGILLANIKAHTQNTSNKLENNDIIPGSISKKLDDITLALDSSLIQEVVYSNLSGQFAIGEQLIGNTVGAIGQITYDDAATALRVKSAVTIPIGEVITGVTTSTTADVTTAVIADPSYAQQVTDRQDTANSYFAKKDIGKIIDLTTADSGAWQGYPLILATYPAYAFAFDLDIQHSIVQSANSNLEANDANELVSILNALQSNFVFSVIDNTHLLINDGVSSLAAFDGYFYIATSNFGTLLYDATLFTDSVTIPLSNLDEIKERLKTLTANVKALAKLTDTQPVWATPNILQEIQMTGQWRGKNAKAFNLIGQRNGFTSTSVLQGVKEYDNGVADFAVTDNATLDLVCANATDDAAGTGVRSVNIVYINNDGDLIETSVVTNGGTSLSVLTGVQQVLWMEAFETGSRGVASGNIILRINGGSVQVEQITAGGDKSRSAIFQVPIGYTGYVANWRVSAINNDQDVRLRGTVNTLDRSINSTAYHYMSEKYAVSNSNISAHDIWLKVPALARIKASTMSAGTAATVRCNVNILMVIIEN